MLRASVTAFVICLLAACGRSDVYGRDNPSIGDGVGDFDVLPVVELALDLADYPAIDAPIAVLGTWAYFRGYSADTGLELWRTDGTAAGTSLFVDLCPGTCDSSPRRLVASGALLFFTATDGQSPVGLWSSDGTAAGTSRLLTYNPGFADEIPRAWSGGVAYDGYSAAEGFELWSSDGTTAGTRLVQDTCPGTCGFTVVGAVGPTGVLLSARDPATGDEPHFYNGAALTLLEDLWPGATGLFGWQAVALGNDFVLSPVTPADGQEPLLTDGTAAGTFVLRDIWPGNFGDTSALFASGGGVFFSASDGTTGPELWRTDGTAAGTNLVIEIAPGAPGSSPQPIGDFAGKYVFTADNGVVGREPWISDGTTIDTLRLGDLEPGPVGSTADADGVTVASSFLFSATTTALGSELWWLDASLALTDVDLRPGVVGSAPTALARLGSSILFFANAGTDPSLFVTTANSSPVALVPTHATGGLSPTQARLVSGRMFFLGTDPDHGTEPWVTDGTAAGSEQLIDTAPGANNDRVPTSVVAAGSRVFFMHDVFTGPTTLFASDGTKNGTSALAVLDPTGKGRVVGLTSVRDSVVLVFAADDAHGAEPWVSDGTSAGTQLLLDITPGVAGSLTSFATATLPGLVVFSATDPTHGQGLWKTDGTTAGTTLITAIPTIGGSVMNAAGNLVYFDVNNGSSEDLWRSDMTAAGTTKLAGSFDYYIRPVGAFGQFFLFTTTVNTSWQLWSTDGTITTPLITMTDVFPGATGCSAGVVWNDAYYMNCQTADLGSEPWRTDGTAAGTGVLADLWPGVAGSMPSDFVVFDDAVYFAATTPGQLRELWRTDGTAAGTVVVDTTPDSQSADVATLVVFQGALWFSAHDPVAGHEWHRLRTQ